MARGLNKGRQRLPLRAGKQNSSRYSASANKQKIPKTQQALVAACAESEREFISFHQPKFGHLLVTLAIHLQVADFGSARFATQEGYHFAEQHPPEKAGEVLSSLGTRTVRALHPCHPGLYPHPNSLPLHPPTLLLTYLGPPFPP